MKAIIDKFTIYLLLLMFSINASAQVRLGGNPEALNVFTLSPDGETLVGCNRTGSIHLWDTATGTEKDVFISEFTIGAGAVLTFSPDGTLLASGSDASKVTVWDVATGEAKFVLEHVGANVGSSISSISFSPDGTTLTSCSAGRWGTRSTFVYLWDVGTGERKSEIEVSESPSCSIFSPDGTTLAIGTTGWKDNFAYVYLWDFIENVRIAKLRIASTPWGIDYMKFSPDGTTLAAGIGRSSLITLWDVVTRKEIGRIPGYAGGLWNYSFAFNSDGTFIVGTGSSPANNTANPYSVDGLYIWDIFNEKWKKNCELHKFSGVSPNGTIYAVENQYELIDGDWSPDAYFIRTISFKEVFMEVAAHGKLATRWADLKMSD